MWAKQSLGRDVDDNAVDLFDPGMLGNINFSPIILSQILSIHGLVMRRAGY